MIICGVGCIGFGLLFLTYGKKLPSGIIGSGKEAAEKVASEKSSVNNTTADPAPIVKAVPSEAAHEGDNFVSLKDPTPLPTSAPYKPVATPSGKSLSYFANILKTYNGLQVSALMKPYINTSVGYTGVIQSMAPQSEDVVVAIKSTDDLTLICWYSGKYSDYLARLDYGTMVSGVGTILAQFPGQSLVLSDCHPAP